MTDSVLRAIADDGSFRVIAAHTTDTVREVLAYQKASGSSARHLGDLVTGAILVRETMAPQLRVQGILKGVDGSGMLVADAHPDGTTRGLVTSRALGGVVVAHGAVLQMMRTMPGGTIHQGIVEAPSGGVSGAVMAYMQNSEQVESSVAISSLFDGTTLTSAGGYLVQLLPEAERGSLAAMTEHLSRMPPLDDLLAAGRASPEELVAALFGDLPFSTLAASPLRFGCQCSKERLLSALSTIDHGEIKSMVVEGKPIEITCDYCARVYSISPAELESLLN
jgi:molecular chaperone Hsp33